MKRALVAPSLRRPSPTSPYETKNCPNCQTSLPAEFSICGNCGTRLDANEAVVETMNRDPSDAIRMLVGPGFSSPQPHTSDSRPMALKRPRSRVKKIIKKKGGPRAVVRSNSHRPTANQVPGWGAPTSHDHSPMNRPTGKHPEATAPRAAGQFKSCTSCGSRMEPENQFCGQCGDRLQPAQPAVPTCMRCGTKGKAGQRFCGSCGGGL